MGCHTCVLACFCWCVWGFRGQSKHPLPPGRKNRNGTCHRVIAQPCSGFTLWERSGAAPCSVTWHPEDRLHHADKNDKSCNMLKITLTIPAVIFFFFHFKILYHSWVAVSIWIQPSQRLYLYIYFHIYTQYICLSLVTFWHIVCANQTSLSLRWFCC